MTTLRSGELGTPLAALLPRTAPTSGVPTRALVVAICTAVALVRLIYVWQPLRSDEGGYLLIARSWDPGGEFLYGDYHVDRPPLLMAIFRLAALSEWDGMIRLISIPFVLVAVVAAARAAYLVAGDRAARWSALVAGALLCSPFLAGDQANGGLFAVALVMVGVALAVDAWERPSGRARLWLAVGAGACGGAAWLVKQNYLDGLVFVAALVLAETLRRRRLTPRARTLVVGAGVGALLPNALAIAWAWSNGIGPDRLWAEVVAFRGDALAVILDSSMRAPAVRAFTLVALALASGLVPLVWTWLAVLGRRTSRLSPAAWGVNGMLVFGLAALVAGGSYWPHYLVQLVPTAALAAGMVAASDLEVGERMRRWARFSAGSATVAAALSGVIYLAVPHVWFHERTGEWLAQSSAPGDTAVVTYGSPSVLEAADLGSPYPFLWSLPMRTLDPDQDRLRRTLAGDDAPTWVVQLSSLNYWRIDENRRLRDVLRSRYSVAATVCGNPVWLRDDLVRTPAPPPIC